MRFCDFFHIPPLATSSAFTDYGEHGGEHEEGEGEAAGRLARPQPRLQPLDLPAHTRLVSASLSNTGRGQSYSVSSCKKDNRQQCPGKLRTFEKKTLTGNKQQFEAVLVWR